MGVIQSVRQVSRTAGLSLGDDRGQTVIAVHVDPTLHEASAASQRPSDRRGIVTFEGRQHNAIAIPLLGGSVAGGSVAAIVTGLLDGAVGCASDHSSCFFENMSDVWSWRHLFLAGA